ncbi:FAD:protein FMN transferase [Arthrobacter sp. SO5]|uniref:FAD:protein FMN transferase n=1 Tax=Arthrobacter sp. SO5 TaxID=1897055 RepID=UPI001E5CE6A2|nr:FAD:protein FMN transferase [Arthrobacter sp. SO5]MCB5275350.1 FAD:protein FMN transferase [Arthrobacter sp. SO5]
MAPAASATARRIGRDAVRSAYAQASARPRTVDDRRPAMGGTAQITLVGGTPALLDECFDLLRNLELRWSRFLPDSEISRLNRSEGRPVMLSRESVRLIVELVAAWSLTGGVFDPTILPRLLELGYRTSCTNPELQTVLPPSARWPGDMAGVRFESHGVLLPRGTTLDPGGLGKGLAADLIVEFALGSGVWGAMAEIGGDVVVAGDAPDGGAWTIAVEDPFHAGADPAARIETVRLNAGAVATSSRLNRRFKTVAGPAHHLIDPSSGHNPTTGAVTTTVIAGSGTRAEALTKVAFNMEPASAFEMITRLGGEAMIVPEEQTPLFSAGWKDFR